MKIFKNKHLISVVVVTLVIPSCCFNGVRKNKTKNLLQGASYRSRTFIPPDGRRIPSDPVKVESKNIDHFLNNK